MLCNHIECDVQCKRNRIYHALQSLIYAAAPLPPHQARLKIERVAATLRASSSREATLAAELRRARLEGTAHLVRQGIAGAQVVSASQILYLIRVLNARFCNVRVKRNICLVPSILR